jgi:UDP-galactopyranose mutase
MFNSLDAVIVGAGLAGSVCAEQMANAGKKVLVIERKTHTGGHCFDYCNDYGIYVHLYGPHIFHTDNRRVWRYLSQFTDWHYYQHRVLGYIDGETVPIPFNLNTMKALFSPSLYSRLEEKLIAEFGYNSKIPILTLRQTEDKDLLFLAQFIYEKIFLSYNVKQWGAKPEDIDPAVSGRVPVVISRDNRYFHNKYQGIPIKGYSGIVRNLLDHPSIHLLLHTDAKECLSIQGNSLYINGNPFSKPLIYTGMIDELFDYSFGELPYRSVDIQFTDYPRQFFQENSLVNYPCQYDFTRITEFKYFQQNAHELSSTTICKEYPVAYERGKNNPYYIVSSDTNKGIYNRYLERVKKIPNLHMVGRLAEYRYYDMDQVVAAGLALSDRLLGR